jgi:hypothetical protein
MTCTARRAIEALLWTCLAALWADLGLLQQRGTFLGGFWEDFWRSTGENRPLKHNILDDAAHFVTPRMILDDQARKGMVHAGG